MTDAGKRRLGRDRELDAVHEYGLQHVLHGHPDRDADADTPR